LERLGKRTKGGDTVIDRKDQQNARESCSGPGHGYPGNAAVKRGLPTTEKKEILFDDARTGMPASSENQKKNGDRSSKAPSRRRTLDDLKIDRKIKPSRNRDRPFLAGPDVGRWAIRRKSAAKKKRGERWRKADSSTRAATWGGAPAGSDQKKT